MGSNEPRARGLSKGVTALSTGRVLPGWTAGSPLSELRLSQESCKYGFLCAISQCKMLANNSHLKKISPHLLAIYHLFSTFSDLEPF